MTQIQNIEVEIRLRHKNRKSLIILTIGTSVNSYHEHVARNGKCVITKYNMRHIFVFYQLFNCGTTQVANWVARWRVYLFAKAKLGWADIHH